MIISHTHKFIFIKPHKTAGTSVELLLSRICGFDDVITPLGFDPDPNVREKHQAKAPQNYHRAKPFKHWQMNELFWFLTKGRKPNLNYWEHLPADKIREYVGEEIWNSYLKISIVRNPWDHAVSMFDWMSKFGYEKANNHNFDFFVKYIYKLQWPFFTIKDVYDIDIMLKFENLDDDIEKIAKTLIPIQGMTLPKTKSNIRVLKNYQKIYKDETKELIRLKNLNIIEKFGYEF